MGQSYRTEVFPETFAIDETTKQKGLIHYYVEDGDENAFGIFQAKVSKVTKDSIFFEELYLQFHPEDSEQMYDYHEKNVWIYGSNSLFQQAHVKRTNLTRFKAKVYAYQTKEAKIEHALKEAEDVKRVSKKELEMEVLAEFRKNSHQIVEQAIASLNIEDESRREELRQGMLDAIEQSPIMLEEIDQPKEVPDEVIEDEQEKQS